MSFERVRHYSSGLKMMQSVKMRAELYSYIVCHAWKMENTCLYACLFSSICPLMNGVTEFRGTFSQTTMHSDTWSFLSNFIALIEGTIRKLQTFSSKEIHIIDANSILVKC